MPRKPFFPYRITLLLLTALFFAMAGGWGDWAHGQARPSADCAPERGAAAERWFKEGETQQKAGRLARAVDAYRSAIGSCPQREELLRKISRAMGRAGLREEGLKTDRVLANLLLERGERKKLAKAHRVMSYTFSRPPPVMAERMKRVLKREAFPNFQADFTKLQGMMAKGFAEKRFFVPAWPHFKKALDFSKKIFGERHPLTFYAQFTLAGSQYKSFRTKDAQANYERAWKGFKEILGADHSMTLTVQGLLGSLLERFKITKAEKVLAGGVKIAVKTYGASHGITMDLKARLASVLTKNGRINLSIYLGPDAPQWVSDPGPWMAMTIKPYLKALELRREIAAETARWLGKTHPSHLTALLELADLHGEMGQTGKGLLLLNRVVSLRTAALGKSHAQTLEALVERGKVLEKLVRFKKAAEDYKKVFDHYTKALGARNGKTRAAALNLSRTWALSGHGLEALKLLESWVPGPAPYKIPRSSFQADGQLEMAGVLAALGRHEAARPFIDSSKRYFLPYKPKTKVLPGTEWWQDPNGYGKRLDRLKAFQAARLASQAETLLKQNQAGRAIEKLKQATALDANSLKLPARLAEIHAGRKNLFQASLFYQEAVRRAVAQQRHKAVTRFNGRITLLYRRDSLVMNKKLVRQLRAEGGMKPTDTEEPAALKEVGARFKALEKLLAGGKFQQALAANEESLEFARRHFPKEGGWVMLFQFTRAMIFSQQGKNPEASRLLEKIKTRFVKFFGVEHPWTGGLKSQQVSLYTNQGNFSRAEPIAEELAARSQETLGSKHPETLGHLFNLASLYGQQGRKDKEIPISKEIWKNAEISLGRYHPQTLFYLQSYISVLPRDQVSQSIVLSGRLHDRRTAIKGFSAENEGDRKESLERLFGAMASDKTIAQKKRTLEKELRQYGPEHWRPFYTRLYLAGLYQSSLKPVYQPKAAELYEKSLPHAQRLFGAAHPITISILTQLVSFGSWALPSGKAGGRLSWDAQMAQNRKWDHRVEQWMLLGLTSSDTFLRKELWGAEEATREAYLRQLREFDEKFISFHVKRRHLKNGPAKSLLQYSLLRKGLLLDIAARVNEALKQQQDPALKKSAARLSTLRRQLAQRTLAGSAGASGPGGGSSLAAIRKEIESLESQLGLKARAASQSGVSADPVDVMAALGPGEVLVDFLAFRQRLYWDVYKGEYLIAVVVRGGFKGPGKDGPVWRIVNLGKEDSIRKEISGFRKLLARPASPLPPALKQSAQRLYKRLWAPLAKALGGASRVYLVPDGILHLLPFNALMDPRGRFLVETTTLIHLTSPRDLLSKPRKRTGGTPVIMGNPLYTLPRAGSLTAGSGTAGSGTLLKGITFSPLPGTGREVRDIAAQFAREKRPLRVVTGQSARESVLRELSSPRILHLATHGFFLPDIPPPPVENSDPMRGIKVIQKFAAASSGKKPGGGKTASAKPAASINPLLRSGLAFSGANQGARGIPLPGGDDGILTALEVLGLELTGTELVVLSACETGVGDIRQGEGVYGLRRAFQQAGAKQVLSTLWQVDDAGTQAFMSGFYSRFLQGGDSGGAQASARAVQLEFIASPRWRHPFYWAPFVMVGR